MKVSKRTISKNFLRLTIAFEYIVFEEKIIIQKDHLKPLYYASGGFLD
jgi:hypothetical protein